jgi:hypothetical protein
MGLVIMRNFLLIVTLIFSVVVFLFSLTTLTKAAPPLPTLDLQRLTFNGNRDDWPVIYKDNVYWLDARGGVYGYNFTTHSEFPFITDMSIFQNFYGLVGYNGRYIVYDSYDNINYNVRIYDTQNNIDFPVSNSPISRYATDFDNNKIAYIEGGGYGDLYIYDINKKNSAFIAHDAAVPRISVNKVVWYISTGSGTYDIKAYDLVKNAYIDIPNPNNVDRSVPDIEGNNIVFSSAVGTQKSIDIFDLIQKKEKTLLTTSIYDVIWPHISKKYAVWGKSTAPNIAGVEGADLQTGQIFEIQPQGSFQNSNLLPYIEGNFAVWFDWRTGNGDIYAANITR